MLPPLAAHLTAPSVGFATTCPASGHGWTLTPTWPGDLPDLAEYVLEVRSLDGSWRRQGVFASPGELVGAVVARNAADIGVQQVSELLPVPGIDLLGPLPPDIQEITVFSAGLHARSSEPAAARALVADFATQPTQAFALTKAALEVLSRSPNGFVLMVESALIDKFTHPLDWERAIYDTIMLDESVRVAKQWAAKHPDTLIMVTPDHTHAISVVGTVDEIAPGTHVEVFDVPGSFEVPIVVEAVAARAVVVGAALVVVGGPAARGIVQVDPAVSVVVEPVLAEVGLGVVVHTVWGLSPKRIPNCNISQTSSPFSHAANSSHHAQ